jgi:hypothetical protein
MGAPTEPTPAQGQHFWLIDKPDAVQTQIRIGKLGIHDDEVGYAASRRHHGRDATVHPLDGEAHPLEGLPAEARCDRIRLHDQRAPARRGHGTCDRCGWCFEGTSHLFARLKHFLAAGTLVLLRDRDPLRRRRAPRAHRGRK